MPSFDVVSEIDMHQLTNAVDQANRVVGTRFDFKGVDASFTKEENKVTLIADADFQITQMLDILKGTVHKCGIDIACIEEGEITLSGKQAKMVAEFRHGIDADLARKIVKMIKEKKLKVQASIQGDQVRVTGKKRDDLQEVIAFLKASDITLPLQYQNFRD